MKYIFTLIIAVVILITTFTKVEAQNQKNVPKLGLALSGGGSKGLAHIGLLRMLDSLGIKPDYITGTSMGSILGALYSIGYSGNELKQLALNTEWKGLLGNELPLSDINIEEKDEYGRYLLELPLIKGKPVLPKGFIEGIALQEFLIEHTYPARYIHSFDSLPIPFRCMATDLNTGEAILMKSGNLTEALRASMAVPFIFTPVEFDNKLLIDGGLVRTLPVKEVIDMGATKVIGSYTGFRVLQPDEMRDGLKIVLQTISLAMANTPKEDKELCNVIVNNDLTGMYSTNFNNVRAIIEAGEVNARAMLPQLQEIADWQRAQNIKPKKSSLLVGNAPVLLQSINISSGNSNSEALIKYKFGIKKNQLYTERNIIDGLNRLYGTRFFDKIYLDIGSTADGKGSEISLKARKSAAYVTKFAVHYDTEDAAGILLNGTFRDLLLPNSRSLLTLDLAQNPKVHFNFYQFIGMNAQFRWTADFIWERTIRNDFLFIKASNGMLKSKDKYLSNYRNGSVGFDYILNQSTLAYVKIAAYHDLIKPQHDPSLIPIPNHLSFLNNESRGYGFAVGTNSYTTNSVFFPKKGHIFEAEIKLGFGNNSDYSTFLFSDSIKRDTIKEIVTSRNQTYIRYRLEEQKWIKLSRKFTLGFNVALGAGFSLNKNLLHNLPDTIPMDNPETFYIGGSDPAKRDNTLCFIGLRNGEIVFSQYLRVGLLAQYHVMKHFYITPSINIGRFTDNYNALFRHVLEWDFKKDITSPIEIQDLQPIHIAGGGLNFGYLSKIGPINLLIHTNSYTNSIYVYFSFGYKIR